MNEAKLEEKPEFAWKAIIDLANQRTYIRLLLAAKVMYRRNFIHREEPMQNKLVTRILF